MIYRIITRLHISQQVENASHGVDAQSGKFRRNRIDVVQRNGFLKNENKTKIILTEILNILQEKT